MSEDTWIDVEIDLNTIPEKYLEFLDRETKRLDCTLEALIINIVTGYVESREVA